MLEVPTYTAAGTQQGQKYNFNCMIDHVFPSTKLSPHPLQVVTSTVSILSSTTKNIFLRPALTPRSSYRAGYSH